MTLYIEGRDQQQKNEKEEAEDDSERVLPPLQENDHLALNELVPEQHFTQPPPRYTEATLVKTLEEKGIGRPSTYASIMGSIQNRGYVEKEKRALFPTEMGITVNTQLVTHFPQVLDVTFTAQMEDKLDAIMDGKLEWHSVIREFYEPFADMLEKAMDKMEKIKQPDKPTDEVCEKCGKPMVIKKSRHGEFMACTGFPDCRNTLSIKTEPKIAGVNCPECGKDMAEKKTRKNKIFFGCTGYPDCKFAVWDTPTGEYCPKCKAFLVENKKGIKCSKCEYVVDKGDE